MALTLDNIMIVFLFLDLSVVVNDMHTLKQDVAHLTDRNRIEIEALKSEMAEMKKILRDSSASESHSNGKFTIISVNKVEKLFF